MRESVAGEDNDSSSSESSSSSSSSSDSESDDGVNGSSVGGLGRIAAMEAGRQQQTGRVGRKSSAVAALAPLVAESAPPPAAPASPPPPPQPSPAAKLLAGVGATVGDGTNRLLPARAIPGPRCEIILTFLVHRSIFVSLVCVLVAGTAWFLSQELDDLGLSAYVVLALLLGITFKDFTNQLVKTVTFLCTVFTIAATTFVTAAYSLPIQTPIILAASFAIGWTLPGALGVRPSTHVSRHAALCGRGGQCRAWGSCPCPAGCPAARCGASLAGRRTHFDGARSGVAGCSAACSTTN